MASCTTRLKAFLVAGRTTTASALAWVWYALAGNSTVEEQLKRELHAVLEGRPPGAQDLHALHYTRMLIKEVLRLYPPTWITARMPIYDDEIGGYRIAADAIVLLSPFVTHRHPGFWEDPERFDPERFSTERSANRLPFAYFPFGGGPRSCIGSGFASVEMQLVVAMVAQRYHLTLVPAAASISTPASRSVRVLASLCIRIKRLRVTDILGGGASDPQAPGSGHGL